jgi:hypothetical protein
MLAVKAKHATMLLTEEDLDGDTHKPSVVMVRGQLPSPIELIDVVNDTSLLIVQHVFFITLCVFWFINKSHLIL